MTPKQYKKIKKDTVTKAKKRIQALLRQLAIARDGGCVLRNVCTEAGQCGGRRGDGELILQAEHLVSRTRSVSFGDMRNIVCLCLVHHGYFKQRQSRLYWELIEKIIGKNAGSGSRKSKETRRHTT